MSVVIGQAHGMELAEPPADGVTNLRFSDYNDMLVVSSWDSTVRIYDAALNSLRHSYNATAPVLDCCFHDAGAILSGGLECTVNRHDFHANLGDIIGRHDAGVKCVEYAQEIGMILSGSWDSTVRAWDPRAPTESRCISVLKQPGKVYTMSSTKGKLVVGSSGRRVNTYDLRNLSVPFQEKESSLKYQTRCIRLYPNGEGYAISSVEGRVAMEYFDSAPEAQAKKYAFKCHRKQENGKDIVYPVNVIAFHPTYGTFVTGGCDGYVNVWDGNNKKRLYQFARYPTSISACAFNRDGNLLAVASSYTFEEGERDHDSDKIFIRNINEAEVKPKPKAG